MVAVVVVRPPSGSHPGPRVGVGDKARSCHGLSVPIPVVHADRHTDLATRCDAEGRSES